jgi:hypothetical protein
VNEYAILAFVVMPIIVVTGAYIAVLAHQRALRRDRGESR